jgi:hypothetical protein
MAYLKTYKNQGGGEFFPFGKKLNSKLQILNYKSKSLKVLCHSDKGQNQ